MVFFSWKTWGSTKRMGDLFFFSGNGRLKTQLQINTIQRARGKLEILEEKWIESVDDGKNRSIHLDFQTPETGK